MNWRWLVYDHIPSELNLSYSRRREIRREVRSTMTHFRRDTGAVLRLLLLPAALIAIILLGITIAPLQSRGLMFFVKLIAIGATLLLFHLARAGLWRSRYRQHTAAVLRRYGYDVCGNCGYLLTALATDSGRCPECGTPRDSSLSSAKDFP